MNDKEYELRMSVVLSMILFGSLNIGAWLAEGSFFLVMVNMVPVMFGLVVFIGLMCQERGGLENGR